MDEIGEVDEAEVAVTGRKGDMVAALSRYLEKKQIVNVTRMALAGHQQPRKVNGAVPDIEGVTSMVGQPVFGVAEECDKYALEESSARLEALSRVPNVAVFLVVPRPCYASARKHIDSRFSDRNITVLPYGTGT